MRYIKRCILSIISLILAVLLTGCAQSGTTIISAVPTPARTAVPRQESEMQIQETSTRTEMTIGITISESSEVNPFLTTETDIYSLNHLVYESVVELDDEQKPAPLLADRWEKVGYTWTFYLREGISFHNGMEITADDVVASYEKIIEMGEGYPYYEQVQTIKNMSAVDEHTLQVNMKALGYNTIYALTFPVAQRATLDEYYPMGTGPYWYVSPEEGEFIRLERNPLWWKRQPYIDVVHIQRYEDASSAMRAFETDQIDALATQAGAAALSRKLADRSTLDYGTLVYECLVPNTSSSLLSDVRLRQALMYALDRNTLSSTVYQDMVQLSEVPVPPGTWLNESQSATYYYSPERALQILYEMGWGDSNGDGTLDRIQDGLLQELRLTLITYQEPTRTARYDVAKLIAEQLGRVGIEVTVDVRTRARVRAALREDNFDLALVAYNISECPSLDFMLRSTASSNYSNYASSEMDALLTNVSAAETEEAYRLAMSRLQLKIVEDLPVLGLFFHSGAVISHRGTGGLSGVRSTQMFRGFEFWYPLEKN